MFAPNPRLATAWLVLALLLAGCAGGATPRLIGAYPGPAVTSAVPSSGGVVLIFDAYLTLRVADVARAAEQAADLAYDHGGYVSQSQTWYNGDQPHVTLSLAVPAPAYDALHAGLLRLGTLADEQVSGSLTPSGDGYPAGRFATLTVHFAPAAVAGRWPALPSFGWSPLATLRAAFAVSARLLTYLIDLVIWLVVVFGPFVLIALALRALVRRWRPHSG
jgi:hypothetical protein